MNKDPVTAEYIIAVFDLENFSQISNKCSAAQIFSLINGLYSLSIDFLKERPLVMMKNLGDAALMVFKPEEADETVRALRALKDRIEASLRDQGYAGRASFSCHIGEIALGKIGTGRFENTDAFGEPINTVFLMNGKPFRNRFVISPRLFRRLEKGSRTVFHKFTPPVVYLAD